MKDLGSKNSQTTFDMIRSRDLQVRCSERWAGEANDLFCSIKSMREHGETGFAKVRIINVVTAITEHDNEHLSKHLRHKGGQKWQHFREAIQKQVTRVQHHLEAGTKGSMRVKDNIHRSE